MALLYPPYLEGTIPSFYEENENGIGTIKIKVPFSHNKTVSINEISGYSLKIKSVQTNIGLTTLSSSTEENGVIIFSISDNENKDKFKIGQYYKFQLAYKNKTDNNIGYYSTVATGKYTYKPTVSIAEEPSGAYIIGNYSNNDSSEKVYKYKFDFLSSNEEQPIITSGWQYHNVLNDQSQTESQDFFELKYYLANNSLSRVKYTVQTTNGLEISTQPSQTGINFDISDVNKWAQAEANYNNGYIKLTLTNKENGQNAFSIYRGCKDDNYTKWEQVFQFYAKNDDLLSWDWKDFTVEQGKYYKYIFKSNNSTKGIISNEVYADFEDMFLSDGKVQLKIKYNPKVSNFKTTYLESKIDTIGSQFPYVFRNGRTKYKDFSISGLISYLSDEDSLFTNISNLYTTNLTSENIYNERIFKLKVLDWLNDGKEKIFRSPTEGNYIVRLMNISLTPNETLGRMLHTFNASAYEIDDFTTANLDKYNLISLRLPNQKILNGETITINIPANKKFENSQNIQIGQGEIVLIDIPILPNNITYSYTQNGAQVNKKTDSGLLKSKSNNLFTNFYITIPGGTTIGNNDVNLTFTVYYNIYTDDLFKESIKITEEKTIQISNYSGKVRDYIANQQGTNTIYITNAVFTGSGSVTPIPGSLITVTQNFPWIYPINGPDSSINFEIDSGIIADITYLIAKDKESASE